VTGSEKGGHSIFTKSSQSSSEKRRQRRQSRGREKGGHQKTFYKKSNVPSGQGEKKGNAVNVRGGGTGGEAF